MVQRTALIALTLISFLSYLDRYVLSAVLPWIKDDFALSDGRAGLLGSMFMVMFLVASPLAGYAGDRMTRKYLVSGGVLLWSLATIGSGLAPNYETLLLTRALIGVGEAGYAVVAPGIIADLFGREQRGRALAWLYLSVPLGSAIGYILGGYAGQQLGWRSAFFIAGAPGLGMAIVALLLEEPRRGATDDDIEEGPRLSGLQSWLRLFGTPGWRFNTVGSALMLFTLGGMGFWMPTFLVRTLGLTPEAAGVYFGGVIVAGGILGTLVGGVIADRAFKQHQGGYFTVSSNVMLAAAPLIAVMPWLGSLTAVLTFSFMAATLLSATLGPLNASLVGCVPPGLRATAVAIGVLLSHMFGDAASPYLVGRLSDGSSLELAIALTAVPVAVGGLVLRSGARKIDRHPDGLLTYEG